jgi:anti-sigma B factor antagonist
VDSVQRRGRLGRVHESKRPVSLIEFALPASGWMIVHAPDTIDISNCEELERHLVRLVDDGATGVVVDLRATTFCDCSGVRALIATYRHARTLDVQVCLVPCGSVVHRLLYLLDLEALIPSYASVNDALTAIAGHQHRSTS